MRRRSFASVSTVSLLLLVFQGCTGEDPALSFADGDSGVGASDDGASEAGDGGGAIDSGVDASNGDAGDGDDADADAEAAAPPVPTAHVVIDDFPTAIDFDVTGDGLAVLRSGTGGIDGCTLEGICTTLFASDKMPAEQAPSSANPNWSNASLAFVESGSRSAYLVAQAGFDKCATNCDPPSAASPGIYQITSYMAARRVTSALPGVFGKSSRTTNGVLVGRGDRFALAQESTNESPRSDHTTVYSFSLGEGGIASVSRGLFPRGYAGNASLQKFAFAATTTPAGNGGYAASGGKLVDVSSPSESLAVAPTLLSITTNDPGAADVFVRSAITPKDSVLTFHNTASPALVAVPFAGVDEATTELVGTQSHVVAFGSPANGSVKLSICTAESLLAKSCTPQTLSIALDAVTRVRSRGSSVYLLAKVGTKRTIFHVTLP